MNNMEFLDIAKKRQSCRNFDENRKVEREKLILALEAARLAPSATNAQPYFYTIATKDRAKEVAKLTQGAGMNKFTDNAPVMVVISEESYNFSAKIGSAVKKQDYRSIDIGISVSYFTSELISLGLSSCIIGWFDEKKLKDILNIKGRIRLVVAVGYAKNEKLREKKRKNFDELFKFI